MLRRTVRQQRRSPATVRKPIRRKTTPTQTPADSPGNGRRNTAGRRHHAQPGCDTRRKPRARPLRPRSGSNRKMPPPLRPLATHRNHRRPRSRKKHINRRFRPPRPARRRKTRRPCHRPLQRTNQRIDPRRQDTHGKTLTAPRRIHPSQPVGRIPRRRSTQDTRNNCPLRGRRLQQHIRRNSRRRAE